MNILTPIGNYLTQPVVRFFSRQPNKNKRFCIGKQKALNRMLEIDKMATDIYTIGYKKDSKAGLDYTRGLILQ